MNKHSQYTESIKNKSFELGFSSCGMARAKALVDNKQLLGKWLESGYHAGMAYMANHFEKRIDPTLLVPGAKSVVSVSLNYFPSKKQPKKAFYQISRYAYGRDYHFVIKDKLHQLAQHMTSLAGKHTYRVFTDSAPVFERSWAKQAGIGTYGKNTCLIIPRKGSYHFLGEIITSMELTPDAPLGKDLCGKCNKCLDACPTQALVAPGILDANKCISYLTIEHKENIPGTYTGKLNGWIFGCDICQEVCPHNRFAKGHNIKAFERLTPITDWTREQWELMTEADFKKYFIDTGSAIARVTYHKFMDNIKSAGMPHQM